MDMPPEQQRQYFFSRYREFNERAARANPIVALVDDLHWADEASLLLLANLATYVDTIPILIIGTYRDVDLEVNRPFARTLEDLTRQRRAHRITLRRLSKESTGDLLQALAGSTPPAGLVTLLHHETEGNPFFVEEVFRHLSEEGRLFDADGRWRTDLRPDQLDVPEGVKLVVGRRLERLSDDARAALTSAALIGPRFSVRVLEALNELNGDALLDALDQAARARLIEESATGRDTTYTFAHELIRQTLISSLSLPRRQRRHLQIADALERAYGDRIELHAADMAYHLYSAGAAADAGRTSRFLVLAAEQAIARVAFQDALLHTARGLETADELPPGDRARLLRARGLALRGDGRWADAYEPLDQAAGFFEQAGLRTRAAAVCRELVYLNAWFGLNRRGVEAADRGLGLLDQDESPLRPALLASRGLMRAMTEPDRSSEDFVAAREAPAASRDPLLAADITAREGLARYQFAEFHRAIELMTSAAALFRQRQERWLLATAIDHLAPAGFYSGRFELADAALSELDPMASDIGAIGAVAQVEFARGVLALARTGDLAEWAESVRRITAAFERTGGVWVHAGVFQASESKHLEGRWSEAADMAHQVAAEWDHVQWRGSSWAIEIRSRAYADPAAARATFEAHRHFLPTPGELALIGPRLFAFAAVEPLVVVGLIEEAAALYDVICEAIRGGWLVQTLGLSECAAGLAAAAGRQWARAEAHFDTALRQAHALPHRIMQPEVRRWHAWMLRRRDAPGDRERARTLLTEALAMYREIGMAGHVRLAEAALAELKP
jgi:hypothetical protein